jgi:hypothetical protein
MKLIIDAPNGTAFGEMQLDGSIKITAAELPTLELPAELRDEMDDGSSRVFRVDARDIAA